MSIQEESMSNTYCVTNGQESRAQNRGLGPPLGPQIRSQEESTKGGRASVCGWNK